MLNHLTEKATLISANGPTVEPLIKESLNLYCQSSFITKTTGGGRVLL